MPEYSNKDGLIEDPRGAFAVVENTQYSARTYRIGSIVGRRIGKIIGLSGLVLIILALAGQIEWVIKADGLSSRLNNASPGALFVVIGLLIILRHKLIIQDDSEVCPGSCSLSETQSLEERDRFFSDKTSWRSTGDDFHYHQWK